ncbi:VWA domain-containing protein [Nocardioides aromaticivorans]|uniref:VWA domain-containing protein n=1 Tax=Nocardioides aromaticivorans TaxID=200618 RepID=A0ABX7PGU5_9ACTN|nr:vWA domain-containing protein [Nocardioides aromaticivorans]QSR25109.1 VWA domain-containing protein [Nocardioides aromaticivorans]
MTRADLTHLYFLLDRSGSMQSIKTDTEGGFAAFVAEQQAQPGECRVTLAQFDNEYDVVFAGVPVADVPPLDLQPRGSTALLDAMGRLVTTAGAELAALPEDERPGTVIVAIMTDGHENASQEWTHPAIRALVEQQTNDYAWQFLYMGADQDAIEVGTRLGVRPEASVTYGRGKSRDVLAMTSQKLGKLRNDRMAAPASAPAPMMEGYTREERDAVGE